MADWKAVSEGFRYDLWANRLWFETLTRKDSSETDRAILTHILVAQKTWLLHGQGMSPTERPVIDLTEDSMTTLNGEWLAYLAAVEGDPMIQFRLRNGTELTQPLSEITQHVLNHGTYHRGELRGLCRARGDEDFPETDYLRFAVKAFS